MPTGDKCRSQTSIYNSQYPNQENLQHPAVDTPPPHIHQAPKIAVSFQEKMTPPKLYRLLSFEAGRLLSCRAVMPRGHTGKINGSTLYISVGVQDTTAEAFYQSCYRLQSSDKERVECKLNLSNLTYATGQANLISCSSQVGDAAFRKGVPLISAPPMP